jgi:threonine aldolase
LGEGRRGAERGKLARVQSRRGFASDNSATVHPAVLDAITAANRGHAFGYGHDDYTRAVEERVAREFGDGARAFFVFNGSGANVLCLRAACRAWQAVICAANAHINVDECAAPEAVAGVKLLSTPAPDGKLTPELIEQLIARVGDEHAVQPGVVSLTQCTELGALYTLEEVRAITRLAHDQGLLVHVDGARLANAAAALDSSLSAVTSQVGVDIVSFGGTKNGLLGAEAVVVFGDRLADGFDYLRKQTLQLASKMRFLAAQFDALMRDQLWRANADSANRMAARLAGAVDGATGLRITRPVQTNAVFATLPAEASRTLRERFDFYPWDESIGEVRWMCSWDTTEDDVDEFAAAIRGVLA